MLRFKIFLDSNVSIIGTGKQEFFKNIENFLNSFKFDVEKRELTNPKLVHYQEMIEQSSQLLF